MPDLLEQTVQDLKDRASRFLGISGGNETLEFCAAGGSAAVFKAVCDGTPRALKVFDPRFFSGLSGDPERRRLSVQKRLIGHKCATLVQTYRVEEAEGTAFVEMEFIEWPQLSKKLAEVPDEAIVPLISQLVEAVQFLDSLNIVHRDIKPENIHVSPDFRQLKLLDLGVARDFDSSDTCDASETDHDNKRPFLATAQYSSPEYLFRLDEPTVRLWRGLNIYQVGAVLHDMIQKEPLFQYEMSKGNRWLVARAVLTKQPSFTDLVPGRLSALKTLSSRCLIKDLETRLEVVGWEDFVLCGVVDPVNELRAKLANRSLSYRGGAEETSASRLKYERDESIKRITYRISGELIHICGTQLALAMRTAAAGDSVDCIYELDAGNQRFIYCHVRFDWQQGLYKRTANLCVGAQIIDSSQKSGAPAVLYKLVGAATINEAENEAINLITREFSGLINRALDHLGSKVDATSLHGLNILDERAGEFLQQDEGNDE